MSTICDMTVQIVWYDQNVFSKENQLLCSHLKQILPVSLYNEWGEMIDFLNNHPRNADNIYVLITSGNNGEKIVKSVNGNECVIGIVVFCMNVSFHRTWASLYEKVWLVTASPDDVIKVIKSRHENATIRSRIIPKRPVQTRDCN